MNRRITPPSPQIVRHPILLHHPLIRRVERHALPEERVYPIPPPLPRILLLVLFPCGPHPGVVVLRGPAVEEHAVDSGAAAHNATGGNGVAAAVEVGEGGRGDVVHTGAGAVFRGEGEAGVGACGGYVVGGVEVAVFDYEDRVWGC